MYVCLSVRPLFCPKKQFVCQQENFHEKTFRRYVQEFCYHLNLSKITGTLHEIPVYIYDSTRLNYI
jgi:hypothetical protein